MKGTGMMHVYSLLGNRLSSDDVYFTNTHFCEENRGGENEGYDPDDQYGSAAVAHRANGARSYREDDDYEPVTEQRWIYSQN